MRRADPPGLGTYVGSRVVVQTRDDRSLRGVLVAVHADCLVLAHFAYLDDEATELPGEAIVLLSNVSWTHRLIEGTT